MRLCRHAQYRVISDIWEPKYSTNEILININKVTPEVEHYLIKFKHCNSIPEWFYMSGKVIRRHKTQKNGAGEVYVISLKKREEFEPVKHCSHEVF